MNRPQALDGNVVHQNVTNDLRPNVEAKCPRIRNYFVGPDQQTRTSQGVLHFLPKCLFPVGREDANSERTKTKGPRQPERSPLHESAELKPLEES